MKTHYTNKQFFTINFTSNIMKKLLFLMMLFTGIVNAQIVNIPDANFKAKLLSSDITNNVAKDFSDNFIKIDANNDGEIQQSEAAVVKKLFLNNSLNSLPLEYTNLTGINSFINIESILIFNLKITTANFNSLSNLKTLGIYDSVYLNTLQINNLTNLEGLQLSYLTLLISLDVSNLANLKVFSSFNVPLTNLDLSSHTNLEKLSCVSNNLSTLNINDCLNLTELNCSGNKLTNLNGLLPGITKLNCSGNLLTSLNLTSLTNLTEIDCSINKLVNLNINGLNNLQKIYCPGNELTTLDLTGLNSLSSLDCGDNKLTNIVLSNLTNLSKINCASNELTNINVNGLTNLTDLDCRFNKLTNLILTGLTNLVNLDCGFNKLLTTISLTNLTSLNNFSIIGASSPSDPNQSILSNLDLSGLPNLITLNCQYNKLTSLNLNNLTNLTGLYCSGNLLTTLNISNLPNLKNLDCSLNPLSDLDASNLTSLEEVSCAGLYQFGQYFPQLNSLNVSGSINLKKINCNQSLLTTINLTGLINLQELGITGSDGTIGLLTSLNVTGLTSLQKLNCNYQGLTSLDVSNLGNLIDLNCSFNQITSLGLIGLPNLQTLDYSHNQLASLNLVNLPSLLTLNCVYNQLTTLNVINLINLKRLDCSENNLTTLNLSGLSALEYLNFSYNNLAISNINGLSTNLKELYCNSNNLTSLDVSNLTNLEKFFCYTNFLPSIDLSTLNNLKELSIGNNLLTTIDLTNLTQLINLSVINNSLTTLNLNGFTNLKYLAYGGNVLPNLNVSFLTNLEILFCSDTQSTNINVNGLTKLEQLSCSDNQISQLDLTGLNKLITLQCQNNQLTTLDASGCPRLNLLLCNNNQLNTLLVKNRMLGIQQNSIDFSDNPNLKYICADSNQLYPIQTLLNGLGMNATVCNSYCTFTPGGNYNNLTGITIFDYNNNGCDVTDEVNPFIRLDVNDGIENGSTVTNINGTYNFYTNAGNYTLTPNVENPTWFNFSPPTATFNFPDNNNNISTQNFCIEAVGLHKDIEVVFFPIEVARPGFDTKYKIVYKNKGNQMHSGNVTLSYDDARTDLIASSPVVNNTGTNSLTWNYVNLMPFENRSIEITLNVNAPTEIPAVNNGDILNFSASITPLIGDELPNDNQFNFTHLVVGSYDPNDITCLEGDTIAPSQIGNYLHYANNFENLGTYFAENVVVRTEIDTTKYDISTLQVMNTSHPSSTRITGNIVEVVFENINLAAAAGTPPVGGHGDVLFKIKTKDNLVTNDSVLQKSGIYFDYNFPIITNDAITTFATLSSQVFKIDESVSVSPNPTASKININCNNTIKSIELYDVQGRVLETILNANNLDISNKTNGIYFLKITTEKGSKIEKVVKE
jgi:Leucine-rich repeat (LRR) protein